MRTWRLIAHHQDPEAAISWFRDQRRIAIGWGQIGDLRASGARTATDITAMIRDAYPELSNAHLGGPSLWRLYDEMRVGDLVIVSDGKRRRLVMRVEGEYQWDPRSSPVPPGNYRHWRPAAEVPEDPDTLWQRSGASVASGESIRWTLVRCDGSTDSWIDVETEDRSDDELKDAIRAGRLRFLDASVVDTSTSPSAVRRRRGQERLRQLTLENYEFRCAVCDVADPNLLVASHVIGWAERVDTRGDLKNIICLCRFHDALFETGYWSLTDDLQVIGRAEIGSPTILTLLPPRRSFRRPVAYPPAPEYLGHHRTRHGYASTRA